MKKERNMFLFVFFIFFVFVWVAALTIRVHSEKGEKIRHLKIKQLLKELIIAEDKSYKNYKKHEDLIGLVSGKEMHFISEKMDSIKKISTILKISRDNAESISYVLDEFSKINTRWNYLWSKYKTDISWIHKELSIYIFTNNKFNHYSLKGNMTNEKDLDLMSDFVFYFSVSDLNRDNIPELIVDIDNDYMCGHVLGCPSKVFKIDFKNKTLKPIVGSSRHLREGYGFYNGYKILIGCHYYDDGKYNYGHIKYTYNKKKHRYVESERKKRVCRCLELYARLKECGY